MGGLCNAIQSTKSSQTVSHVSMRGIDFQKNFFKQNKKMSDSDKYMGRKKTEQASNQVQKKYVFSPAVRTGRKVNTWS